MDYKEKYEKLHRFVKDLYPHMSEYCKKKVEGYIPEFAESEDEKIRKILIENFSNMAMFSYWGAINKIQVSDIIAWLEKQESVEEDEIVKGISVSDDENIEGDDNVEPKFRNGQWIVWQDECYKVNYNGCGYELVDQNGLSTSLEYGTVEESAHLWTIEDAKDGDVLTWDNSKCIALFKNIYDKESFNSHGCVGHCTGVFEAGLSYHDIEGVHPAIKDRCDLLFQKMKEVGYVWDAENKELKLLITNGGDFESENCGQKPAWSEEDERMFKSLNKLFNEASCYSCTEGVDKILSWFNSLKDRVQPQPKQEED